MTDGLGEAHEAALVELCQNADDIKCGPFGTQLKSSEFRTSGVPLWGIKQVNRAFPVSYTHLTLPTSDLV